MLLVMGFCGTGGPPNSYGFTMIPGFGDIISSGVWWCSFGCELPFWFAVCVLAREPMLESLAPRRLPPLVTYLLGTRSPLAVPPPPVYGCYVVFGAPFKP